MPQLYNRLETFSLELERVHYLAQAVLGQVIWYDCELQVRKKSL
jgi:hypothetical protein